MTLFTRRCASAAFSNNMTRIVITGAKGRMGQALINCARSFPDLQITGQIDVGDDIKSAIQNCDAVIDFSFHNATASVAELCAAHSKALVIGTTGHSENERAQITKTIAPIPVVWASNYSTGVNALFWLTRKAAEILGPDFDLEVVEMHHRLKKDAPSGTATTLGEILADVRKLQTKDALRHGREGIVGERTKNEIGMHSLRGGDVVGDHTVIYSNIGERLELTHKASSRDTFANGALRAAQWVVKQQPGLYSMQHVLALI
jgi:4-hydroxy-tetrahydrodipicolinate reductase